MDNDLAPITPNSIPHFDRDEVAKWKKHRDELAARDQRIRELEEAIEWAMPHIKNSCYCELGETCLCCQVFGVLDQALAPQPAKEGEDALLARLEGDDENTK